MAGVVRAGGVLPLIAAAIAAATLTGAAVFTVAHADCTDPAHFVTTDGQVQLVGGCLGTNRLPHPLPADPHDNEPAGYRR